MKSRLLVIILSGVAEGILDAFTQNIILPKSSIGCLPYNLSCAVRQNLGRPEMVVMVVIGLSFSNHGQKLVSEIDIFCYGLSCPSCLCNQMTKDIIMKDPSFI